MRQLAVALLLATACILAPAQEKQTPASPSPRREIQSGLLIPSVRSESKSEQSYALYIPSAYSADRPWPIVYVFDPGANGPRPLELMKDAAERYGYILAGSNNSRNGSLQLELNAANAMWADTHSYLSIDDQRVFFAGFSGGARLASYLAQICDCARGAFLSGAALMQGGPPLAQKKFAAFSMVGLGDYNYDELLDLDSKLDALGQPHFLRRFEGEHQWAPAPVWEEALAWSALLEMKNNLRPRDSAFIAVELAKSNERLKKQIDAGELSFALQETRGLAAAFDGLADTAALKRQAAALEKDPVTRARAKQEKSEVDRQHTVANGILQAIASLQDSDTNQLIVVADTTAKVRQLRQNLLQEKNVSTRRVLQRVLGNTFITCMELGGPILS